MSGKSKRDSVVIAHPVLMGQDADYTSEEARKMIALLEMTFANVILDGGYYSFVNKLNDLAKRCRVEEDEFHRIMQKMNQRVLPRVLTHLDLPL